MGTKAKARDIVRVIVTIMAAFLAINLMTNFITYIMGYGHYNNEQRITLASDVVVKYFLAGLLTFVALIMNIVCRKEMSKKIFWIKSVGFLLALMALYSSSVAIVTSFLLPYTVSNSIAGIDAASLITESVSYLIQRPFLFYTYILAVVIDFVFAIWAIVDLIRINRGKG